MLFYSFFKLIMNKKVNKINEIFYYIKLYRVVWKGKGEEKGAQKRAFCILYIIYNVIM